MKKILVMLILILAVTSIYSQEVYYTSFGYVNITEVETISVIDPFFGDEEVVIKFKDNSTLVKKYIDSESELAKAYNTDLINDYINLKKELETIRRLSYLGLKPEVYISSK